MGRAARITRLALGAVGACLAGLVLVAPVAGAAPLRAGAAVADITPANGGSTLGFVRPDITVQGVHTRLTGRALVLDDGDTEVVLLATDLAFALDKDSLVARVRDLGFTHETILYTGTHTHSGPEELEGWQVEQLARAIREAHANRVPARAGWAAAEVGDVNRNRSVEAHLANHRIEQFYGQGRPGDDPLGEDHTRDTRLRVLRVERTDGTPLAAWMNFPVHLTTSTPAVDVWDSDIAAPATHHLEQAVGRPGFVALYANGSLGDLMPRFDAWNPTAAMDLHGRRIAARAGEAWTEAGERLTSELPVDVRWTRRCYCGQAVEPGHRVSSNPVWGLAFFGGSEDGASIFHEPLATEGRRLPEAFADPVHGRKIIVAPGLVHESQPEVHVIRVGDRLLLGAPGEPSVEMGRRFEEAVAADLPEGVTDPVVVGLSNDYMGYLTTPEEYEMQHYEGGHTVFGTWTSVLVREAFADLTRSLAHGRPAPAPSTPAELGSRDPGASTVGGGGVRGALVDGPEGRVERMTVATVRWTGAPGGIDRPLDEPFVALERLQGGAWRVVDSDLALSFIWRETDGRYSARYDVGPSVPEGIYRLRVISGRYELPSEPFPIVASDDLRLLGVVAERSGRRHTRLVVHAQNPPPDPERSILWRPVTPEGGHALLRLGGRPVRARWDARREAWVARVRGRVADGRVVMVESLVDGAGNRTPGRAATRVGRLEQPDWPRNMGVGGGRTPGPFGQGEFPP
jgi:neutral ceramidase